MEKTSYMEPHLAVVFCPVALVGLCVSFHLFGTRLVMLLWSAKSVVLMDCIMLIV